MDKVKVLFLAANPAGTQPLKLDQEIRQITEKMRAAQYRDSLELVSRWAVRPDDLLQALLEEKPHIVHFSGHGTPASEAIPRGLRGSPSRDLVIPSTPSESELIFQDSLGRPRPVSKAALVHLFQTLKDNVRVVLLNACYSRPQAEALAETIDCTVGMNRPIGDDAAIVFAASFYRAVGFGRSVQTAFELGKAALLLEGIAEDQTPELLTRPGVDAGGLVLIAPSSPAVPSAGGLEAKVPGAGPGVPARLALVRQLGNLAPADWSVLVTVVPRAASQVSRHGTIPEQVAELVRWAEGPTGPGLAAIEEAFEGLRNPR